MSGAMKVDGKNMRSIWLETDGWSVGAIDQSNVDRFFGEGNGPHLMFECGLEQDVAAFAGQRHKLEIGARVGEGHGVGLRRSRR